MPVVSYISQLLYISNEIYENFDCSFPVDTRGTSLDISKAFDRIWHEGLTFKLKFYGIEGNLLILIKNYFKERKQRVVLNGPKSSWQNTLLLFHKFPFEDLYCF